MTLKSFPFSIDIKEALLDLEKSKKLTLVNVGNIPAKNFLISDIIKKTNFRNIFWASSEEKSDIIAASAEIFFEGEIVQIPANLDLKQFYKILQKTKNNQNNLFLFDSSSDIFEKNFPNEAEINAKKIVFTKNSKINIYKIFEELEKLGYKSTKDNILSPGEFIRKGENFFIFPINKNSCFRINFYEETIEDITEFDQKNLVSSTSNKNLSELEIFPINFDDCENIFLDIINKSQKSCFVLDDIDNEQLQDFFNQKNNEIHKIQFTTFPKENTKFFHLNFFSVLSFYTIEDFIVDIKERLRREFCVLVMTKKFESIKKIFRDRNIMFTKDLEDKTPSTVKIIEIKESEFLPHSFQNNDQKILFLTDREIFHFHRSSRQKKAISGVNFDLMTSLKRQDLVIHVDHGLAKFDGIVRKDLGENFGVREYLKLDYASNDKLFVPVESAEKVTKFIGDEIPKLTRLDSSEWHTTQKKLKKETERIAKDLLKLYAVRELEKSIKFSKDNDKMNQFCEDFPYDPTPGQMQTWFEVKKDMERDQSMDRLVCGDVGFGKTEIAMRAAFKAFSSGVQTAFLAPITILAEQHFRSFEKRVKKRNYDIRIELLSRFQKPSEQKKILEDTALGLVDIVIGTHRLLSDDIKFKNLGLLIIDEEQRFGVSQKEKLKKIRTSVDVLTLTATPIPRTLNMSLNKLKDISTITTPPPGRLPVITEVRKYNLNLIRERILLEKKRDGQVYFLHNQVKTIEAQAQQLKTLIPECKFIVAHGQLTPQELESRVRAFKNKEADVLIASTIIENGIDLPNANTLIVNRAEKFGLSQLYQLRGRVGRSRTQAYAYFLYHGQKLELEAKKRLRAIVEANELGSGFQIAMRDLEIRGAGEILGVSQSGTIKTVGVSHFMRMLNKTVEEMKSGEISSDIQEEENISVDIPLSAYIPGNFIPNTDEKIQVYKELAGAENFEHLDELKRDIESDYGKFPTEVENLYKVIRLKLLLRKTNLMAIKIYKSTHKNYEILLRMGKNFSADQIFPLIKNSSFKWIFTSQALKLRLENLSVNWYSVIFDEIKFLCLNEDKKK